MKNAHFLSFERKLHFDEMCWRNEFSDEVKKHFITCFSLFRGVIYFCFHIPMGEKFLEYGIEQQ